jgi:hypothetical protein
VREKFRILRHDPCLQACFRELYHVSVDTIIPADDQLCVVRGLVSLLLIHVSRNALSQEIIIQLGRW